MIKNLFKSVRGNKPTELLITVGFGAMLATLLIFALKPSLQMPDINIDVQPPEVNVVVEAGDLATGTNRVDTASASYNSGVNLLPLWNMDGKGLVRTESEVYDVNSKTIYVSNIGPAHPWDKTKFEGFISKVDLNGNVVDLKWVDGLTAPKGMALTNNKLFVATIDRVVEIDLSTKQKVEHIALDVNGNPALRLNDVVAYSSGDIYASDTAKNVIYRISDGVITEFLRSDNFTYANGLMIEGNNLHIASYGTGNVYTVRLSDKSLDLELSVNDGDFTPRIASIDGLTTDGKNGYFASNWAAAKVFHMLSSGERSQVLSIDLDPSFPYDVNTADIHYITSEKMLLVPTFFNNSLLAYRVEGL